MLEQESKRVRINPCSLGQGFSVTISGKMAIIGISLLLPFYQK